MLECSWRKFKGTWKDKPQKDVKELQRSSRAWEKTSLFIQEIECMLCTDKELSPSTDYPWLVLKYTPRNCWKTGWRKWYSVTFHTTWAQWKHSLSFSWKWREGLLLTWKGTGISGFMWEASRVYRKKSMSFGLELVTNLSSQPHISCATWAGLPLGMLSSVFQSCRIRDHCIWRAWHRTGAQ